MTIDQIVLDLIQRLVGGALVTYAACHLFMLVL
jgi:hypothetical protein